MCLCLLLWTIVIYFEVDYHFIYYFLLYDTRNGFPISLVEWIGGWHFLCSGLHNFPYTTRRMSQCPICLSSFYSSNLLAGPQLSSRSLCDHFKLSVFLIKISSTKVLRLVGRSRAVLDEAVNLNPSFPCYLEMVDSSRSGAYWTIANQRAIEGTESDFRGSTKSALRSLCVRTLCESILRIYSLW